MKLAEMRSESKSKGMYVVVLKAKWSCMKIESQISWLSEKKTKYLTIMMRDVM